MPKVKSTLTNYHPPRTRTVDPLSYSIVECTQIGLGSRATIYGKIGEGVLKSFKDGTRTRITADSVKRHHADLVARSQGLGAPVCRPKAEVKLPPAAQAAPTAPKLAAESQPPHPAAAE
jgi:hypothetical protein